MKTRSIIPCILLCATLSPSQGKGQAVPVLQDVTRSVRHLHPDSLSYRYPNVSRAPGFESQAAYALDYYPELRNVRIQFRLRRGGAPLSTRPTWGSLWRSARKRTYVVFIADSIPGSWSRFLLRYADTNAQVGIIGHELAHIYSFSRMSFWQMLELGVGHASYKYMDRFEYRTDSLAVERGLGYQLLAWNRFIRKTFGMPEPEEGPDPWMQASRERYMRPSSIRRVMKKSATYPELSAQ